MNEVYSGGEEDPEAVLIANGFVSLDGKPFDTAWIGWSMLYMIIYWGLCTIGTALGLTYWRATTKASSTPKSKETIDEHGDETGDVPNVENGETDKIVIPFKPVTLSFQDLCYEVTASTSKEKLMLLKQINGVFRPGRMCALMGTSGAG